MGEIADALRKANAERAAGGAPLVRPADRADASRAPHANPTPQHIPVPTPPAAPRPQSQPVSPPEPSEPTAAAPPSEPLADVVFDGAPPQIDLTRHLALRVCKELEQRGVKSIAVVSPLRNEGKTTVACNLALAIASVSSDTAKIALVDLDLRNPSLAGRLGLKSQTGVDDILLGRATLDDACIALDAPRIDVYPAIKPRTTAHALLLRSSFADMMRELHARYEVIVLDTPPTLLVPDSTLILKHAGCCVPVAHAGITRVRMFKKMLGLLPQDQIVGKILNAAPTEKHERDYYAYGYGEEPDAG